MKGGSNTWVGGSLVAIAIVVAIFAPGSRSPIR